MDSLEQRWFCSIAADFDNFFLTKICQKKKKKNKKRETNQKKNIDGHHELVGQNLKSLFTGPVNLIFMFLDCVRKKGTPQYQHCQDLVWPVQAVLISETCVCRFVGVCRFSSHLCEAPVSSHCKTICTLGVSELTLGATVCRSNNLFHRVTIKNQWHRLMDGWIKAVICYQIYIYNGWFKNIFQENSQ